MKPYYQQDGITIYHGDCRDILPQFPDKSFDLVLTSPPYDGMREYAGYDWDFEPTARELYRVLCDGGVLVWVVGDQTINGSETLTSSKQKIYFREVCGFNIHDTMIYRKNGLTFPETNRYYPAFEYMFVLSKGRPKTVNLIADVKNKHAGDKIQGGSRQVDGRLTRRSGHGRPIKEYGVRQNVWDYSTGWMVSTPDEIAFEHPCVYPENLARDHIYTWTNPGDSVLDCFNGAGTTTKKAKQLGRKAVGIEIEEKYCEIAVKRLAQMELFAPVGG